MSVSLVQECIDLESEDLTPSEKHILTILCFRANKHHEAYMCIDKLIVACSSSRKTVERGLKGLRDKKYLSYTGKIAPNSTRIPVYKINLNTPKLTVIKNC
jgi:hypothetical protein